MGSSIFNSIPWSSFEAIIWKWGNELITRVHLALPLSLSLSVRLLFPLFLNTHFLTLARTHTHRTLFLCGVRRRKISSTILFFFFFAAVFSSSFSHWMIDAYVCMRACAHFFFLTRLLAFALVRAQAHTCTYARTQKNEVTTVALLEIVCDNGNSAREEWASIIYRSKQRTSSMNLLVAVAFAGSALDTTTTTSTTNTNGND